MHQSHDVLTAKRPPRVIARPDIDSWSDWEPMNLEECCALFFPHGPLTVRGLRTAVRDGALGTTRIAGKIFTSKQAVIDMMKTTIHKLEAVPGARGDPPAQQSDSVPSGHRALGESTKELMRVIAAERARLKPPLRTRNR